MLRVRSIKSASVQVHVTHQSKCRWIQRSNFVTGLLKQMVTGELCVLKKSKLLQEQLSEDYSDLDCRGLCQAFVFSDCCILFSFDLMIGFYYYFYFNFFGQINNCAEFDCKSG